MKSAATVNVVVEAVLIDRFLNAAGGENAKADAAAVTAEAAAADAEVDAADAEPDADDAEVDAAEAEAAAAETYEAISPAGIWEIVMDVVSIVIVPVVET